MLRCRPKLALVSSRLRIPIYLRSRRYYHEETDPNINPNSIEKFKHDRPLTILGIETSCDDTCVAVLRVHPLPERPLKTGTKWTDTTSIADSRVPRAQLLFNQNETSNHIALGGIHPVIAVRNHRAKLPGLLQSAMEHLKDGKPDVVAVTRGPGQMNALEVGLGIAKGLAFAWGCPFVAVNHMHAHALTPRLVGAMNTADQGGVGVDSRLRPHVEYTSKRTRRRVDDAMGEMGYPQYPYLSLLISGGHTQIVLSKSLTENKILASSLDTAIGDAVDKIARIILPEDVIATAKNTNYGRLLEHFVFGDAVEGESAEDAEKRYDYDPDDKSREENFEHEYQWTLPKPLESQTQEHRDLLKFSFTGLRAHLDRNFGLELAKHSNVNIVDDEFRRTLGWLAQKRAFEHLAGRVRLCLLKLKHEDGIKIRDLVVSGGVASNKYLRVVLKKYLESRWKSQLRIHYPPISLCTDNAAMIAWTGYEMFTSGWESDLEVSPLKKWAMDADVDDPEKGVHADRDNIAFGLMETEGWKKRKREEAVVATDGEPKENPTSAEPADAKQKEETREIEWDDSDYEMGLIGVDDETYWNAREWESVLDSLSGVDPLRKIGKIDWGVQQSTKHTEEDTTKVSAKKTSKREPQSLSQQQPLKDANWRKPKI